jgi:hypothetical protein
MILSLILHRHYFMTAGSFQLFHFLWDANDSVTGFSVTHFRPLRRAIMSTV